MIRRVTLDLAIVTSCHNYGKYIREWAESILAQEGFLPSICVIVDNGSTDTSARDISSACSILNAAGVKCITKRMSYANFGAARNRAVESSGETEWVMHLDADDVLMPHALSDFNSIREKADVVGFGYQRSGNLSAGPRNRTRTYSTHRGKATLKSNAPCSGVSPFRRKLWKKSPYREDMRGGWDTALWIGFAHLNARFVPTRRPVFYYRQHADSVFNTRRINERKGKLVGVKLNNLRNPGITDGVSVIVPMQSDSGHRDNAWRWIRQWYEDLHPDWEIIEGIIPRGEPWRKGVAVADGISKSHHHTLIIADEDCFIDPSALTESVKVLREENVGWVIPHRVVHRLDDPTSMQILRAPPSLSSINGHKKGYQRPPYEGYAGGGMFVVDRSDYEATGGIPIIFQGWGAEDECLALVLDTILEPHRRLGQDLIHLYHPTSRGLNARQNRINRSLFRIFLCFQDDPDAMWELAQYVREGNDPRSYAVKGSRINTILMKAIETHHRGRSIVKIGEYFRVSEEEARQYRARARKIAVPVNGSILETVAQLKRR